MTTTTVFQITPSMNVRASLCMMVMASHLVTPCSAQTEFTGTILDAEANHPVPARVYLQRLSDQRWLFVQSATDEGSALPYAEQWVPMPQSIERHTTVSAHPFKTTLEPGNYEITIERGKEYLTHTEDFTVTGESMAKTFRLQRFINLAEKGWFSGETHVHRRLQELPNVMLAEDLNVTFPVSFWTTQAYEAPHLRPSTLRRQGPSPFGEREDRGSQMIAVDRSHVIYPRNTEYEIFSVDGKSHLLGALFILNHQSIFSTGMPPVGPIAQQAHREGALLDLDKHSWPWSMMLVPVAGIDLYELANNSLWRTKFGFRQPPVDPPAYMTVERHPEGGLTEKGWLHYGWENYYTLLNCGFRLQPTAGTASGVHPVPLGYSRVYVHLNEGFSGPNWIEGLKAGRSFVTSGPLVLARANGQHPGHTFAMNAGDKVHLEGEILSPHPLASLEVVQHGEVSHRLALGNQKTTQGAFLCRYHLDVEITESTWFALRCLTDASASRLQFAHTAPWHVTVAEEPPRPRKEEIAFLIERMKTELARHEGVLQENALAEFRQALATYERIAQRAR